MKNILLMLWVTIGIASCSHSDSEKQILNGILTGDFIEVTPNINRTTLIFSANSNQLQEKRMTDGENPGSRTFSIRILENNLIELSSNEADEAQSRILHYLIIDNNTFEIGNINQNDLEGTIMVFERN
ncbi:hypothetical protein [Lacinutrix jangbogonensis]|uniref:hypothetical protein n=1 Tax=Lacinutrix jangbogonensis TaxID=1469557 RepID=UPI00053E5415|nr:hypothetical protein [Lacinutrix jangbogonensis]